MEAESIAKSDENDKIGNGQENDHKTALNWHEDDNDNESYSEQISSVSSNEESFKDAILKNSLNGEMTQTPLGLEGHSFGDHFNVKKQFFETLTLLKNRKWIATVRSPIHFLHYTRFSLPQSKGDLANRVQSNGKYFLTNYIVILIAMLLYSILARPLIVVLIGALCYGWLVVSKKDNIAITSSFSVGGNLKHGLYIAMCLILFVLFAGKVVVFVVTVFFSLTTLHLIFHESKRSPEDEAYDELGETNLASAV